MITTLKLALLIILMLIVDRCQYCHNQNNPTEVGGVILNTLWLFL